MTVPRHLEEAAARLQEAEAQIGVRAKALIVLKINGSGLKRSLPTVKRLAGVTGLKKFRSSP
jgi:hypothetical protein